MCTVSFLPSADGFRLAMNRDEKRARVIAEPPRVNKSGTRRAILPREPGGGSWIALNDAGVCVALINWHTIAREPRGATRSRGQIVEALACATQLPAIARILKTLPLDRLRPFRLLAIVPASKELVEWRWDLRRLHRRRHAWKPSHWFSSGYDEPQAERVRSEVCATLGPDPRPPALRRLHRSHAPERGPFSICMHRKDAATVSYTEVRRNRRQSTMRYVAGPPCAGSKPVERRL